MSHLVLLPVLLQVLLTLTILGILPIARARSMRERRQKLQDVATAGDADWNDFARKVSASYKSQFELPVLFYVACGLALTTRTVDFVFLTVAAAFVLARIAHAAIHIGPNVVIWRFRAFAAGLFLLVAMWGILAWRIAISGF